jgi:hypothetical protein
MNVENIAEPEAAKANDNQSQPTISEIPVHWSDSEWFQIWLRLARSERWEPTPAH